MNSTSFQKAIAFFAFVAAIAVSLAFFINTSKIKTELENNTLRLGKKILTVEIANTPLTRQKGLSDREVLAADHGMLFVMDKKDYHVFWMKNMRFAIDIIWIDGNEIVDITYNAPQPVNDEPPQTFRPIKQVDKVLEVNAGVASASGAVIGDFIIISDFLKK